MHNSSGDYNAGERMEKSESKAAVLRAFLQDFSAPCPMCGYDLRNLTSDVCPECGHQLELQLALKSPKWAAYFVGLVGLSASFGVWVLNWFANLVMHLSSVDFVPWTTWQYVVFIVGTIIAFLPFVWWLRHATTVRRYSALVRWTLALCGALSPFVSVTAMMLAF